MVFAVAFKIDSKNINLAKRAKEGHWEEVLFFL